MKAKSAAVELAGFAMQRSRGRRCSSQRLVAIVAAVLTLTVSPGCSVLDGDGSVPPKVIGYVPYWDQQRGFATVRHHLGLFDEISPVWYSLDAAGRVILSDRENTVVDRPTVRFLQGNGIKVIPTITDLRNGDWDPAAVSSMLHDVARRRAHVQRIAELVATEAYDGIDIDYEDLQAADRTAYSAFLHELADALHSEGKLLTSTVHPKVSDAGDDERNLAQDFRAIGAVVDEVRVMTYDYHWETSPPGPIAPADWVRDVIAWTVRQVPRSKVVVGAVLLGYDWVGGQGTTVDYLQATALARSHRAAISRTRDGSPSFTYITQGRSRNVWFEDATSVRAKVDLVHRYHLGGVFFWRLGGEDPAVWSPSG